MKKSRYSAKKSLPLLRKDAELVKLVSEFRLKISFFVKTGLNGPGSNENCVSIDLGV